MLTKEACHELDAALARLMDLCFAYWANAVVLQTKIAFGFDLMRQTHMHIENDIASCGRFSVFCVCVFVRLFCRKCQRFCVVLWMVYFRCRCELR